MTDKITTFSNSIQKKIGSINSNNNFNSRNNNQFSNVLPHIITGNEHQLINSILPDKGFASPLTDPISNDKHQEEKLSLKDVVRVDRTIEECRMAMKIEPFCRASALMMMILVASDFEIYGTGDADEDVVSRIQDIARDVWELESKIFGIAWRSIVDGKYYMNKVLDTKSKNILIDFLAYDAEDYDFIKLVNPGDQEVLGYVQKAKYWKYPEDWNEFDEKGEPKHSFEELATPDTETISIPLLKEQVIHGAYFEDGEGLIMGILDDVYAMKDIANAHPDIIKAQLGLIFVQMGTEDRPFTPYNDTDSMEVQKYKLQEALNNAQKTFAKGIENKLTVGTQTTNPKFIGSSNMGALNLTFASTFHAHRIFIGLLTPPGRWEGSGTNKASIETQIGDGGQYSAVYFLQNMIKRDLERDLINHQIELLVDEFGEKATNSIDKVKIRFRIKNLEDRKKLAEVFKILEDYHPSMSDDELNDRLEVYMPEYSKKKKEKSQVSISQADYAGDKSVFEIPSELPVPEDIFANGMIDTSDNKKIINGLNNYLKDKGVFKQ
jgi:hypothetical protein